MFIPFLSASSKTNIDPLHSAITRSSHFSERIVSTTKRLIPGQEILVMDSLYGYFALNVNKVIIRVKRAARVSSRHTRHLFFAR